MCRLLGLILFFIGVGMVIGILAADLSIVLLISACCLMLGYHLFCK